MKPSPPPCPAPVDDVAVTVASCHHFAPYDMHGWEPDPNRATDENFMEMVMLLTRNSVCRQGHMACVLAHPPTTPPTATETTTIKDILDSIVSVAVNSHVYKEGDSDNHAEINALAAAARGVAPIRNSRRNDDDNKNNDNDNKNNDNDNKNMAATMRARTLTTLGCTAYITMPPCKRCFGALWAAGIQRIVTSRPILDPIAGAARRYGIQTVVMDSAPLTERISRFFAQDPQRVGRLRAIRKAEQRKRKRHPPPTVQPKRGERGTESGLPKHQTTPRNTSPRMNETS